MVVGRRGPTLAALALTLSCATVPANPDPEAHSAAADERPAEILVPAVEEGAPSSGIIAELWGDALLDEDLVGGITALEGIGGDDPGPRLDIQQVGDLSEPEPELPSVELLAFAVEGLEPESARHAVEVRLRAIATCVAEHDPGRDLEFDLVLDIEDTGEVRRARLEGGPEGLLAGCITRSARRWHFRSGQVGELELELRVVLPPQR